ncbi:MAG TPA: RNA polymerase sigma factor [Verrucomicrobiae bacterium]|jgi:RNA polymerase sigma-70 factor (ECF subfamily)|nr:RNA polymerase sigma factor [Verrucomicrobiae bacterium]
MLVASEREQLPVAAARAGDAEAWGVLLARFRLPLYAYVFELVHQEQTSLDIVQETFINAARHIGTLRDDEKFASWLFNIAHQKCIQHWRRVHREEISIDPQDEILEDFEPGPRDLLIRKEQEAEFMRLLDKLAVPHRAVLLLYFVEDFSLEEIAHITGTQLGTVKSRLHYARKAFKKLFEENQP